MLSCCLFDLSVGVGVFVIGLSQISSFFSDFMCKMHVTDIFEWFYIHKRCPREYMYHEDKTQIK